MLNLPAPVLEYLQTLTKNKYSPAYLLVAKDGSLSSWGGKLTKYGVTNLQKGEYVGKQVLFLEGLLPLDSLPIILPRLTMEYGICVDVHVFSSDEGDWVLLLDASEDENQYNLIQQKGNDLSLLRYEQSRILNQHLGTDTTEQLAQKILNIQVRGERRELTILIANLCQFTSYSESNPTDLVLKALNFYISIMSQPIVDEGGIVDKIVGGTIISFFGVLPTVEPSPQLATKAAIRMIEAVADANKVRKRDSLSAFHISIGIASGSVTLGLIGNKDRRTISAIGYPVDLAMKLNRQAQPNEVLIDENTFKKLAPLGKDFSLAKKINKAVAEPIKTYSHIVQC